MQTLSAILLSVALLLSGMSSRDADPDMAAKVGSYFIRVLEAAMRTEADAPTPASVKNIATVKEPASLYSSYSQSTKVLAQLKKGDELSIKRRAVFSSTEWVYATAKDYNVSGWVLQSQLYMPGIVEDADLDPSEISEDYVPAYAKMGIVSTDQLNIRTAPGTGFDRIGAYRSGDRVGIIETNNGWGRTAKGWIYLGYVYLDGQVGSNPMVGSVTADRLNIRSGPGMRYTVCGSYYKGERLLILEQIYSGGSYWGCTRSGWVCMDYVQPDYIPGTTKPIYGYGLVEDAALYIYPSAGTNGAPVGQIPLGSVVPILETTKVGNVLWGRISDGWINMTKVDMRAIFEQAVIPSPPVAPTVPTVPTEPATEPATDPTTPATDPTTPASEPTTPATDPTTAASEPTTAASEPTTAASEPTTAASEPTAAASEPTTASEPEDGSGGSGE